MPTASFSTPTAAPKTPTRPRRQKVSDAESKETPAEATAPHVSDDSILRKFRTNYSTFTFDEKDRHRIGKAFLRRFLHAVQDSEVATFREVLSDLDDKKKEVNADYNRTIYSATVSTPL